MSTKQKSIEFGMRFPMLGTTAAQTVVDVGYRHFYKEV